MPCARSGSSSASGIRSTRHRRGCVPWLIQSWFWNWIHAAAHRLRNGISTRGALRREQLAADLADAHRVGRRVLRRVHAGEPPVVADVAEEARVRRPDHRVEAARPRPWSRSFQLPSARAPAPGELGHLGCGRRRTRSLAPSGRCGRGCCRTATRACRRAGGSWPTCDVGPGRPLAGGVPVGPDRSADASPPGEARQAVEERGAAGAHGATHRHADGVAHVVGRSWVRRRLGQVRGLNERLARGDLRVPGAEDGGLLLAATHGGCGGGLGTLELVLHDGTVEVGCDRLAVAGSSLVVSLGEHVQISCCHGVAATGEVAGGGRRGGGHAGVLSGMGGGSSAGGAGRATGRAARRERRLSWKRAAQPAAIMIPARMSSAVTTAAHTGTPVWR